MSADPLSPLDAARGALPAVVELRRRLHRHPELGLDLPRTKAAVLDALEGLGLELVESASTSGFTATLAGAGPGPTLLLRADMDALPMPEDTGLAFASELSGRMHACGHDAHAAMLVGAARLLAERRELLAGRVRFFFQAGEEGHFGALRMIEEGLADGADAAFALHVDPRLERGRLSSRPGTMMASADVWRVELRGRGGHASMPHDANDPVPAACELVLALQALVTRRFDAFDPVVITCARIAAGTTNNVIPEAAQLLGTLRATSDAARARGREGIERVARGVAAAHELEADVTIEPGYAPTVNDPDFTARARAVAERLLGPEGYVEMHAPLMGAEDFGYVLRRAPGAMFRVGVRPPGVACPEPCHSNRMHLDEDGLAAGVAMHAALALEFLKP